VVSIGSLSSSIVHPREVFQPAVSQSAASVVLAHNHPSGDVSPSQDDIELTRCLVQAGEIMGYRRARSPRYRRRRLSQPQGAGADLSGNNCICEAKGYI